MKKQIDVVGAVIRKNDQILCAQRGLNGSLAGLWEFPGGKIEVGETKRAALEREIVEELRCVVSVGDEITTTSYEYPFGVVRLTTFHCELEKGTPQLTEHAAVLLLEQKELKSLNWAPADIPAVEILVSEAL
ncbi:(deoxy)nucleoside triphosphate pyrophosphohydrolase [Glutamicibacter creatinolyticus]|uniref:(deoxy)nucleoside triphosphate pyrophosphohydrolase n=1 Tax=Glutamicibacter creatinolyticus TaxID=162496 RepID=UPI0037BFC22E